jgi:hypothetical protein
MSGRHGAGTVIDAVLSRRPGPQHLHRLAFVLAAIGLAVAPDADSASARTLTVDRSSSACSDTRAREAVTASAPWCTLVPASTRVEPGDTVSVRPGTYTGFRPARSGTSTARIRYVAAGGPVTLVPSSGVTNAVMLVRVNWLTLDGFTITGGSARGLWVEDAGHVELLRLRVNANPGAGIALFGSHHVVVWRSELRGNGRAGIVEYAGSADNQFSRNTIVGNGKDGDRYNGDGIQLAGVNTTVTDNTVAGNGDVGGREHGIYAAAAARSYTIERNTVDGGPGAAIKAQGTGVIRHNRLGPGLYGLVLSDNPAPVAVIGNVIGGRFQHAVMILTGTTRGQATLWHNTIAQTGRSTSAGNAAALFVESAGALDIRNNLVCYVAADNLGPALWINAATRVASLRSDTNWFCGTDPDNRGLAWNGSLVTLAQWRSRCGCDTASIASSAPTFDSDYRVTSANLGSGRGQPLPVGNDIDGTPYARSAPDIGAYQD